ncbi:MAG TPA: ankyrin repeat domain-containing protein [Gemmatimonadaceae bacterium]|nr:ankyrin repeat domain-containing protein [Gemmatimonadaceae bacterium]
MPSRDLPARPHLDHLKHEAKALHRAFREGDANAVHRIRDVLGVRPAVNLTDVQRVIAREYGFPTWARLRAHVQASRGFDEAIDEFLAAVQAQDAVRASRVLRAQPRIATESLHVAAVLGLATNARRLIAEDRSRVTARAGDPAADPLLLLCYSPFHGESAERDAGLVATARLLLDAGADPNTSDGRYGVPALYAVTGVRSVLPIARLLLDSGANPTDGESVFHAAERFHEDALELLLGAGADLNHVGDWGNTPLSFLLRWWDVAREVRVRQGLLWLLHHGADPNVRCGTERENALHVAARRGQSPAVIRLLVDHGADVHARRGDGRTAWLLARRGGFDEVAALLESAGAETQPLSPPDMLLAACGRGDVDAACRLTSFELVSALAPADRMLLPEAAATGRGATVAACVAAGFPVDTTDGAGATALHHAAIHGRAPLVRALLDAGADVGLRDSEHASSPLGWACFGADHVADTDGDYEGCVRALLDAGARVRADEHQPQHAGVRALLEQFSGAR